MLDSCTAPYAAGLPLAPGALLAASAGLTLVLTPEGTVPFFGSLGPTQATRRVVGSIALFLGVLIGCVALSLIPILLGAIAPVHLPMAFFLSNPHGGWEFSAFAVVAFVGSGMAALRALLQAGEHKKS